MQEKDSHNFLPSNGPPPTATQCLALSCPNHHVVVVEIINHSFSLLKHFSNAVGHGLVNVTLTAVKDFLKQDLSNLEIAVQPKVSRGEIRAIGRPIISTPASSRHHSVPKDVGQKVHGSIAGMQCGAILSGEFSFLLKYCNYTCWNISLDHRLRPRTACTSGRTSSRRSLCNHSIFVEFETLFA